MSKIIKLADFAMRKGEEREGGTQGREETGLERSRHDAAKINDRR